MKINDYANENPILTGDKVLGTAAADGSTKNFTVDELVNFVEGNITGWTGSLTVGILTVHVTKGIITGVS
jgi:hypothetical protein